MVKDDYEIVIFTSEHSLTAFPIVNALDPKRHISYKLVRDATHFIDGVRVKNLDELNRDLTKVIVVDWNRDAVKFHPENVFHVEPWMGNDDDTSLMDLTAFLLTVAGNKVDDVRSVLNYYRQFDDGPAAFKERSIAALEKIDESRSRSGNVLVKSWAPSLFSGYAST